MLVGLYYATAGYFGSDMKKAPKPSRTAHVASRAVSSRSIEMFELDPEYHHRIGPITVRTMCLGSRNAFERRTSRLLSRFLYLVEYWGINWWSTCTIWVSQWSRAGSKTFLTST